MKKSGIDVHKSNWAKPRVQTLRFFKSIFEAAGNIATLNGIGAVAPLIDSIEALKPEHCPEQRGWLLIARSLATAIIELAVEKNTELKTSDIETENLDNEIETLFENADLYLDFDFFKNPGELPLLKACELQLIAFWVLCGISEADARNLFTRLPAYFTSAISREWKTNPQYYSELISALTGPFDEAERNNLEWVHYRRQLLLETEKPVFGESFSLRQIYVPLRACYKIKDKTEKADRTTVDGLERREEHLAVVRLHETLHRWVQQGKKDDEIRVIHGGPGIGKSSFLKMFAAELAERGHRVLFIPLHHFELSGDMVESVSKFLKYSKNFTHDVFDQGRLLLIFDGLDELSMQGSILADAAERFVTEVQLKLATFNSAELRLQILISGRDVIIQRNEHNFRKEGQVIKLLPYYMEINENEQVTYVDSAKLLKEDQRNSWWVNYGRLKGKELKGLPKKLNRRELEEITAQPLLNYLLALSYERGKIVFDSETSLSDIYEDLMLAVYERAYSSAKTHRTVKDLEYNDFCKVMENIAVAAWHGNGRTTTLPDIAKYLQKGNIQKFKDVGENNVVGLLAAFYFRKSADSYQGVETFEFTHKSFSEFLIAKYIIANINRWQNGFNLLQKGEMFGCPIEQSSKEWIELFGPKSLDFDIEKFLKQLAKRMGAEQAHGLQNFIVQLINLTLHKGLPLEQLVPRPNFKTEYEFSINAERALLTMHASFAECTGEKSTLNCPDGNSLPKWINKLNLVSELGPFSRSFCNLMLSGVNLQHMSLAFSNFTHSDLSNAILFNANLRGAILLGADLSGADLSGANLIGADLEGANLIGANLIGANLYRSDLTNAKVDVTDFAGADLSEVITTGVDFSKALNVKLPPRRKRRSKE